MAEASCERLRVAGECLHKAFLRTNTDHRGVRVRTHIQAVTMVMLRMIKQEGIQTIYSKIFEYENIHNTMIYTSIGNPNMIRNRTSTYFI